ncbi:MAG: amino acid adenylation domain-containing protein [Lachnospiraceae bacterium]|nr:amino acid adenylation domain-containing protein [Lachnospiraceae bacterium]
MNHSEKTPLSHIQYGLYIECTDHPESTLYNLPYLGRFAEAVDPQEFKSAVEQMIAAHPALNYILTEDNEGTVCQMPDDEPLIVSVQKLSDEAFAEVRKTLVRPFDLHGGKLARFEIYETPSDLYFFEDLHHLICDGQTLRIMAVDIGRALRGEAVPEEGKSFAEIIREDFAWEESEEAQAAAAYWKGIVNGAETGCLPEQDVWDAAPAQGWITRDFPLEEDRFAALRTAVGFSTSAFFTAAAAYTAHVFTGRDDILLNTIYNGRTPETAGTCGMMVRTMPFRLNLEGMTGRDALLGASDSQLAASRLHSRYSYLKLAEEYGLKSEFEFAYQRDYSLTPLAEGARLEVERIYDAAHIEASPLLLEIFMLGPGKYRAHLGYRKDLYSDAWGQSFIDTYLQIVRELLEKEDLKALDLLSEEELALQDRFNATETPYDESGIVTQFRRRAKEDPDRTCVISANGSYTYGEIDRMSDAVAAYLQEKGAGSGKVVSILIPRNEYMAIGSLGALKAGAAYQPLDPSYPEARLQFMMENASAALLIADEALLGKVPDYTGPVLLTKEIPSLPAGSPQGEPGPEDLFILLYTSGTTGTPKGVMLLHRNLSAFVGWIKNYMSMDKDCVTAAYASFGFDANMMDMYPILTAGGTLCVIPEEIRLDLNAINRFFDEHGVTHCFMTTQVGRQFAMAYEGKSLRHLYVGGETLVPIDPSGFSFTLHNFYGPTECTVLITAGIVDKKYHRVPIGKVVDNVKLYVADRYGRRMPLYAPGELWAAGKRVGKGYLELPEKTAEAFIPNPFTQQKDYERVYRTGDVVRLLSDGNIDFIGRNDSQVKVRGFRIELTEVEGVIRDFPGIRDATVQAFADESTGMKYLAAYVVSDEPVDVSALNAFIRERKPPYMVPSVTMQLDTIPLTQNQKVNKRALPQPKRTVQEYTKPENESQQKAFDCAAEALGHRDFGVDTDLEEAGMSSIAAMRLNVLLSKAFSKTVRISDLKEMHTVRDLAAFMSGAEEEKTYELRETYPLSGVQQGVLVECMSNPNSTLYNIPILLKLDPSVDLARLKDAITAAVNAHPYLKMQLVSGEDGSVSARRMDDAPVVIEEKELDSLVMGFAGLVLPFQLIGGRLYRIQILRDAANRYLFIDAHHLVFDGESLRVLTDDLNRAYEGTLPEKERFTGFEAALSELELRSSPKYEEAKAYYSKLLDGFDTDCLPVRDQNEPVADIGILSCPLPLPKEKLAGFLQENKITVNALLNAAFAYVLMKYLARKDCVFTTVYNGRSDSRLSDAVGMFVHTLPVVLSQSEGEGSLEFIRRTGAQLQSSMANDLYPFAEIAREFDVKANVMFVYEGELAENFTIAGKPAESVVLPADTPKAAMTFFVHDAPDGFRLECEYEAQHYQPWSIRSMMESLALTVQAFLRGERLQDISLLTPEKKALLDGFNATETAYERTDLVTLFRRRAKEYPDRTAVIYKDTRLSYREVDALSDRIAAYAQNLGIGNEDVISILIPRGEYMVTATLGALKSGAAYQPLDPSYPPERLSFMVEDAGAKLVIADEELLDRLPDYRGPVLLLKDIVSLPETAPKASGLTAESLLILLYTSGTTGKPKGVMLTHGNLVNFCHWYRGHYGLTADSVVAAYASYGFDACMMDLYTSLTTGAAVCIVPEDIRIDLPVLNRYYTENGVTHVFMTTQMGRMFASEMPDSPIRHLSVGGEKLVPIAPPAGYTLTNIYGPTECTICATTQEVDKLYDRIPIGFALSNYKVYVADDSGHELPVGAMGELYIAGHGVGRGYLNLPERTAQSFVKNPFSDEPGFERAFRTGDIVRRLDNGSIDFIGRNDGQVKIRGFRIELAEVEGVIREYPGIKDVTVQAFEDESFGGKYIAAYVVSDALIEPSSLNDFIRSKKPPYMVPAAMMQLDAIPLNQNQKVNKRALPKPERREESRSYEEPRTPLEKEICEQYASILGLERVSATDSFFDIGGTSISAARVVMFAMNKGYSIVYKDVFDNPSPRELARVISGIRGLDKSSQAADYDYTEIDKLLAFNSIEHVDEISRKPLGNIILAGATGFLGIHVLREYLNMYDGSVYCLIRRGTFDTPEMRMMAMLMYYFGDTMEGLFGKRIFCVEGDITDKKELELLDPIDASTVINCAACVKHFANDDILDRINFHGVENLAEMCVRSGKRLIQISTLSVAGEMDRDQMQTLYENKLYFGQNTDNDYVRTKFLAERAILESRVRDGLDACIIRVGNLMSRYTDGEFQINFLTNAFMRSLWAYKNLGQCPVTALEQPVEFSPIDSTAQAVLTLAGADKRFSVFHANNDHAVTMADVLSIMKESGLEIEIVPAAQFAETLQEASKQAGESEAVISMVAYANKEGDKIALVGANHRFTTNALYRCGFKWPIIDDSYLRKSIWALDSLGFFNLEGYRS